VLADGIVRGPHLKRHLVIGAKIYRLDVAPSPEIPEVDPMAIFVREQILRHDPVLELRRQRPLARHHMIVLSNLFRRVMQYMIWGLHSWIF
jgi:hypothetical protein